MSDLSRVFILGAGFSKPAGMPLATELLRLVLEQFERSIGSRDEEMRGWLDGLQKRLAWLSVSEGKSKPLGVNIEQVFHYAYFDVQAYRLRQQLAPIGRRDGPDTPWSQGESIKNWLSLLEDALRDVIHQQDDASDLATISRWAETVGDHDAVLTFNYDTLVERALAGSHKAWDHGFKSEAGHGIPVWKLHGSIDWVVAHRCEMLSKLDLLFDKQNVNRPDQDTGYGEEDCRLWRFRTGAQRSEWIGQRDLQLVRKGATPMTVGIAGLGAYKELHQVPGLGEVWVRGMQALKHASLAVVVGFSMSDFDAMAQMQFAIIARSRLAEGRALPVLVVDPCADEALRTRFRRVFRFVHFVEQGHDQFDWASIA